jgi:hypothetical protein
MKNFQSVLVLVSAALISSIDSASIGDRSTEAPDDTHEKLMKLDLGLSALTNLAMLNNVKSDKRIDPVDPSVPFARMASEDGVHTVKIHFTSILE